MSVSLFLNFRLYCTTSSFFRLHILYAYSIPKMNFCRWQTFFCSSPFYFSNYFWCGYCYIVLFFICRKILRRKKSIQNVDAKLHPTFTFFFHLQNKQKMQGKSKRQQNQCIPLLFTKKREQGSKQQRKVKPRKNWWRIHCAIVYNNVKDRGQFWLFRAHCTYVCKACNIIAPWPTLNAAESCPVVILKTGHISSPDIIDAFCSLILFSFNSFDFIGQFVSSVRS